MGVGLPTPGTQAFASASAREAAARLPVSTAPSSSRTSKVTSKAVFPYLLGASNLASKHIRANLPKMHCPVDPKRSKSTSETSSSSEGRRSSFFSPVDLSRVSLEESPTPKCSAGWSCKGPLVSQTPQETRNPKKTPPSPTLGWDPGESLGQPLLFVEVTRAKGREMHLHKELSLSPCLLPISFSLPRAVDCS